MLKLFKDFNEREIESVNKIIKERQKQKLKSCQQE
jgi:hypothetical protein